ncbi:hypothetical protein AS203_07490 [Hoylesella enoeca]|uniref:Uncharacterized protein n=1 Tax=Hoylesella enoeca TaxID=76123 RepID=A0A0S2KKV2_9BACT|nr:hypothetical protein AS203_07490 [Hoylesella enoeca]
MPIVFDGSKELLFPPFSYHYINLFPKKKQSSISFEIRDFPCPNPVVNSLLFHLQDFGNIDDVQVFRFQWRVNGCIYFLFPQDEQTVELIFHILQFIKQAFLPCIFRLMV